MLSIARSAFHGRIPFPVIHIDNGIEFPETYAFRDDVARKWKIDLIVAESVIEPNLLGDACCGSSKTAALKGIMSKYGFDALMVSTTRADLQAAKTRNYHSSGSGAGPKPRARIRPMLDFNEIDVWRYIRQNDVPTNPLYFSRNGIRYTSLGCVHCAEAAKSNARTVDGIIKELESKGAGESAGHDNGKEKEYVMQKLRSLGYA
jgi:sulfate adenylyltransferase subunit 2